jgi:hypothetical protein
VHVFAHWSLPAVVLISGFGAVVMCVLLLRDWFPSSGVATSDGEPPGGAGLTRLGHAFAATCFATIAVIAVIGLVQQGRTARQVRAAQDGAATKIAEVREDLLGLDKRMASVESRLDSETQSAERVAHRIDARVAGFETRMTNTQTALRQMSSEVARMQASVKQIERIVAEASRAAATRGQAEAPRSAPTFVRRPASLSSAPSASPSTEPPRPQPEARMTPETAAPGVPPAPIIALPSPASASPSREDRLGPQSPPRSEPDLKTKLREDWETAKRDARNTGHEIKETFRKFRDWISP